ncbi:choice-of-anchor L domain-containing protein [Winogradskyella sp.]|jgi:hypothetical protein|uniref:choice-of-anchor L domain-containing protein n=1 Tax=Winogradskyella sp. TaxID=1883156 RepID=UPI0025FB24AC|nr:choice-of-anchor L domain-containing protein [Winogradskyella sp.]MCT4628782.1 T9SS type A sorting domain-containing protein [Winogradskyella sp.]
MKKLLLTFLLLFTAFCYAQVANGPQTLEACDDNNDGFVTFDLTVLDPIIIGAQNPVDFTVSYFLTQMDADTNSSQLPYFYTNISNPQTIVARVTDNSTGNFDTTEVTLLVNPVPVFNLDDQYIICTGLPDVNLPVISTNLSSSVYSFEWFYEGNPIAGETSSSLIPNQPGNYSVAVTNISSTNTLCTANAGTEVVEIDCATESVTVDESAFSVQELVEDVLLAGQCSEVSNVSYSTGSQFGSGNPFGIGYFSTEGNTFPFSQGLVISNGSASAISGPNTALNSVGSGANTWPGDMDLQNIIPTQTYNATVIEFDFIPEIDEISFEFLMASEEYGQGSFECSFSDVFAILLTDSQDNVYNLAEVPGSGVPISVSGIHPANDSCDAVNEAYFGGYLALNAPPIQLDGRTEVFTAQASVNIGESYHIKLVIADALDSFYDTAVFFNSESFDIGELCSDTDDDGVIDDDEDINGNGNLDDDDTDNDGTPNYLDDDDDGDNVATADEIQVLNGRTTNYVFIDTDNDTIENYLDDDDDGDGVLTIEEDYNNNGDPADDDTNTNGIPDYLDNAVALSLNNFSALNFKLYPNPAKDLVTIQLANFNDSHTIELIDIRGKLVYTKAINSDMSEINISALKSGLYFVKITNGISSKVEKLVID